MTRSFRGQCLNPRRDRLRSFLASGAVRHNSHRILAATRTFRPWKTPLHRCGVLRFGDLCCQRRNHGGTELLPPHVNDWSLSFRSRQNARTVRGSHQRLSSVVCSIWCTGACFEVRQILVAHGRGHQGESQHDFVSCANSTKYRGGRLQPVIRETYSRAAFEAQ